MLTDMVQSKPWQLEAEIQKDLQVLLSPLNMGYMQPL